MKNSLSIPTTFRLALALALLAPLGGCVFERVGTRLNQPTMAQPAPVMPVMPAASPIPPMDQRADGSLWTPGLSGNPFADDKAFRRGDIVLVRVIQKSSGSKSANLDTKRDATISAKIKYLLGLEKSINDLTDYKAPEGSSGGSGSTWDPNDLISAQSSRAYKGQGSAARSDVLQATVSAVVTDVMSNGNLMIYGHQTVMLDNESSVLTVQGVIRPSDIDIDNSVDSSRIANANIQFTGSGVITDQQHPGWGMRIFDWVWPF